MRVYDFVIDDLETRELEVDGVAFLWLLDFILLNYEEMTFWHKYSLSKHELGVNHCYTWFEVHLTGNGFFS